MTRGKATKNPTTGRKPATRKKAGVKAKSRAKTPTPSSTLRARARKATTKARPPVVDTRARGKTYAHTPPPLLTDPAHEIVKAIHEVAVQVKVLGETLAKNPVSVPATVELTVEPDERDEQLELAHDKISELSDTVTRLEAKNLFLLSVVKRGKGER